MATQLQDVWIVSDGCGEYVMYYNPTGHVMHFTKCREEASRTTDSRDAFEVARIARELYRRSGMRMSMVFCEGNR